MKHGMLTFIKPLEKFNSSKNRLGLWVCDCGNEKEIAITRVINNRVKSCGCLLIQNKHNLKHGMKGTKTYSSWMAAKFRCNNQKSKDFERYGGNGIKMCKEWQESFDAFLKDMGERPPNTTLDRIDLKKGYEPGNCRWATKNEQARNKKTTFVWFVNGQEFQTAEEAAVHFKVTVTTITRWVLGYFDKRRNAYRKPKEDCFRRKRNND